jgi:adenylosuccinate synthase
MGTNKIGTTGRGIGPCYEDKASRRGIRFVDLLNDAALEDLIGSNVLEKNFYLEQFLKDAPVDADEILRTYRKYGERLRPHVIHVSSELNQAIRNGKQILFEGAQGTHLDIDHGTYPYVTSSNTLSANACCGSGVGPNAVTGVVGVVKAYTTRVGEGPFPSELFDDVGDRLQNKGAEFGATTGRKRRCGWLDTVILNNAVMLNGLTGLAVTKLDVLGGLKDLMICTAYECAGERVTDFPADLRFLAKCRPVYETLPGWTEDISGARVLSDLPTNTVGYLRRIEQLTGVPVTIVSVGPGREQTIVIRHPFAS